ncbi:MAG: BON domain-containing protein [Nitrospirae bacterium]|nr:BON domain-containing protein [Nitrospirota bacterium]
MYKEIGWGELLVFCGLFMGLTGFSGDLQGSTDLQIETVSLERLRADTRLDAKRITIKSEQHRVTLGGAAATLEDKYLAERIVGSTITGIKSINNVIQVVPTSKQDREIEVEAQTVIKTDTELKDTSIKVEVNKGIVRLTGEVRSYSQILKSIDLVASIKGVQNVVSGLKISVQQISDETINLEVATYLEWSPLVDAKLIHVSVQNGVVHLTGKVNQLMHVNTVVNDISDLLGVVGVVPTLEVQG